MCVQNYSYREYIYLYPSSETWFKVSLHLFHNIPQYYFLYFYQIVCSIPLMVYKSIHSLIIFHIKSIQCVLYTRVIILNNTTALCTIGVIFLYIRILYPRVIRAFIQPMFPKINGGFECKIPLFLAINTMFSHILKKTTNFFILSYSRWHST